MSSSPSISPPPFTFPDKLSRLTSYSTTYNKGTGVTFIEASSFLNIAKSMLKSVSLIDPSQIDDVHVQITIHFAIHLLSTISNLEQDGKAAYTLGKVYMTKTFGKENLSLSKKYFMIARDKGSIPALLYVAQFILSEDSSDSEKAFECINKAIEYYKKAPDLKHSLTIDHLLKQCKATEKVTSLRLELIHKILCHLKSPEDAIHTFKRKAVKIYLGIYGNSFLNIKAATSLLTTMSGDDTKKLWELKCTKESECLVLP